MISTRACVYSAMLVALGTLDARVAVADEPTNPEPSVGTIPLYSRIPLSALVQRISGSPRKTILIGEPVRADVVTGDLGSNPVSYSVFLTILRNNGLTAVVTGDVLSVIPEASIRSYALRTVTNLEQDIPPDEWVNFTIRPQHISAPQLVPILRPLMPQAAHLAAFPEQNTLLIVDRFANVKRIVGIVRQLDQPVNSKE